MRLCLALAALVVLAAAGCVDPSLDGLEVDVGLEEIAPRPESVAEAFTRIPIEVSKGGVHGHLFTLEEGGEVEFRFEANLGIDVRLLDPDGRELGKWEGVDHLDEQLYVAEMSGQYKLEFDNSTALLRSRLIALLIRIAPPQDEE